jgi:acetolactate synthase-1/2/3 large subunit
VNEGVGVVFGLCGHGNLALLDALADAPIRFISVYHEQVAAHAADAYFRVSGKPGVVVTTIGPGLTNTITGLVDAQMDSSAVVVIAGDVPVEYVGRGALQELQLHEDASQAQIFRPFVKRIYRPLTVKQLPEMVARAFATATSGCPGPVLVSVPLDLYSKGIDEGRVVMAERCARSGRIRGDPRAIAEAVDLLLSARRPLICAGGGAILSDASPEIVALAEYLAAPVATTMSGQSAIPEDHVLAAGFTGTVGTPTGNAVAKEADVILAVGARFPEMDCNSWREEHFWCIPPARLIHVDIEPREIGKIYPTAVGIVGDAKAVLADFLEAVRLRVAPRDPHASEWVQELVRRRQVWQRELYEVQHSDELPMQPAVVLRVIRELLPPDGILVSGVGIRHAVGQHFPILRPRTLVVASGFGTMGQEIPALLGAKLGRPDKPVVGVVGDGAFHSVPTAVGTAAVYRIPVTWVVLNNRGYASIAVYQAKHWGRYFGTYFEDERDRPAAPDTVALARAYGVRAVAVDRPDELRAALQDALASAEPNVIDVRVTERPLIQASGHWDVNDILAAGVRLRLPAGQTAE